MVRHFCGLRTKNAVRVHAVSVHAIDGHTVDAGNADDQAVDVCAVFVHAVRKPSAGGHAVCVRVLGLRTL